MGSGLYPHSMAYAEAQGCTRRLSSCLGDGESAAPLVASAGHVLSFVFCSRWWHRGQQGEEDECRDVEKAN